MLPLHDVLQILAYPILTLKIYSTNLSSKEKGKDIYSAIVLTALLLGARGAVMRELRTFWLDRLSHKCAILSCSLGRYVLP